MDRSSLSKCRIKNSGVGCRLLTPPILYSGLACVVFQYSIYPTDAGKLQVYTVNGGHIPWQTWIGSSVQDWLTAAVTIGLTGNNDQVSSSRLLIRIAVCESIYVSCDLKRR